MPTKKQVLEGLFSLINRLFAVEVLPSEGWFLMSESPLWCSSLGCPQFAPRFLLHPVPIPDFFFLFITLKPRVEGYTKSMSLTYEPASKPLHIYVE